mgnify:CR=1 FL=1
MHTFLEWTLTTQGLISLCIYFLFKSPYIQSHFIIIIFVHSSRLVRVSIPKMHTFLECPLWWFKVLWVCLYIYIFFLILLMMSHDLWPFCTRWPLDLNLGHFSGIPNLLPQKWPPSWIALINFLICADSSTFMWV